MDRLVDGLVLKKRHATRFKMQAEEQDTKEQVEKREHLLLKGPLLSNWEVYEGLSPSYCLL